MKSSVIQGCFPQGLPRTVNAVVQPFTMRPTPAWVQARLSTHHVPQPVQRQTAPHAPVHPNAVPLPHHLSFATHGGQPLPAHVRQKMEVAFGADFRDVRIHVGPHAQALGATSFTHGSHIHFAPGHYDPHSQRGQRILGRELAHVVQQRAGRVRNPFGNGLAIVQDRMLEAEAERMAMRAAAMHAMQPIQRKAVGGGRVVQRVFDRSLNLQLATLSFNHQNIEVAKYGSFWRLDPDVASECYIYETQVTNNDGTITINDADVRQSLQSFLTGTLHLYRGVPRWHETFFKVNAGTMASLGVGQLPDTSTHNTKFLPFTPQVLTARNFAKTRTPGFGSHRSMEYVFGYDPGNPNFVIGVVAHVAAQRNRAIGIINASEIQIAGPLSNVDYDLEVYRMGSLVSDLHTGLATHVGAVATYGTHTLGEYVPDRVSKGEARTFRRQHGALLHEVLIVPANAVWIADDQRTHCTSCNTEFGVWTRKHHCRVCGEIFCNACSTRERRVRNPLRSGGHEVGVQKVRVCDDCYANAEAEA